MKKFTIIMGAVAVVVIGILVVIALSVNIIIKSGVEKYVPPITKTDVKLDGSSVSFLAGKAVLHGILVGNPKGFETDSAFKLDEVSLAINIPSLFSDTVRIESVLINAPSITYEIGQGTSNISSILENVKEYSSKMKGEEKTKKKETAKVTQKAEKKVIIGNLFVKSGQISVSHQILKGKKLSLALPDIHLSNIGGEKKEGKPMSETLEEIIARINQDILKQIAQSRGDFAQDLKNVSQQVRDTMKNKISDTNSENILNYFKKK